MRIARKCLALVIVSCVLCTLVPEEARAWRLPWRRKPKVVKPKLKFVNPKKAVKPKAYKYIKSHDLNGDGKVNAKDRLIWLNTNKASETIIYISTENEDLFETMDVDGDGDVEKWERERFFAQYDTNRNGALDPDEIEAALD